LRRALGMPYALSAIMIMWFVWVAFVVFLCNPTHWASSLPFPTVDKGGWVENPWAAALIDTGLIGLFALQHSLMARPAFKSAWARLVPHAFERTTYVHAANIALMLLIGLWQPIDIVVWDITLPWLEQALWGLFALGWTVLLAAGLSFGLSELLGLQQVRRWEAGLPATAVPLKTGGIYRWLRHPMYIGVLTGVWVTPSMTAGHLLLASGFTIYVLAAMRFEERDLATRYGRAYLRWRG